MTRATGRLLAVALLLAAMGSSAAAQTPYLAVPSITWRVENPFRFFTDAADTEVHRATYLALPPRIGCAGRCSPPSRP